MSNIRTAKQLPIDKIGQTALAFAYADGILGISLSYGEFCRGSREWFEREHPDTEILDLKEIKLSEAGGLYMSTTFSLQFDGADPESLILLCSEERGEHTHYAVGS